jgi:hypothetical protein
MRSAMAAAALLLALPTVSWAQAIGVEGIDDGGLVDRQYSHTGTLLLDTFDFLFEDSDHHLTQILIAPDFSTNGNLRLGYHDQNLDDDYFYRIRHEIVNDLRVQRFTRSLDICDGGSCTISLSKPAGDFVFVLTGFQLSYQSGIDHHVDEVGLLENNGNLTVYLNDENDDDLFLYSLQWAWVPRDLFSTLGTSSGTRERGFASRSITPGRSVIRGFRFNFQPYFTSGDDHHIKRISVYTQNNAVDVDFHDVNADDGFDWEVRWGILN